MNRNYGKRWHDLVLACQSAPEGVGAMVKIHPYGGLEIFVCSLFPGGEWIPAMEFPITPKGLKDARKALLAAIGKIKAENSEPRLTAEAQAEHTDFRRRYENEGCACFISPPCNHCTHPGNPINIMEGDGSSWVNGIMGAL